MKREEKEQRERERARKKSSREGQNKEETMMRMIKENYMFLLSVSLWLSKKITERERKYERDYTMIRRRYR